MVVPTADLKRLVSGKKCDGILAGVDISGDKTSLTLEQAAALAKKLGGDKTIISPLKIRKTEAIEC